MNIRSAQTAAYKADQGDANFTELLRIVNDEGMTSTLDMLASISKDARSRKLIQACADQVEHGT